jgi:hypothetical protein
LEVDKTCIIKQQSANHMKTHLWRITCLWSLNNFYQLTSQVLCYHLKKVFISNNVPNTTWDAVINSTYFLKKKAPIDLQKKVLYQNSRMTDLPASENWSQRSSMSWYSNAVAQSDLCNLSQLSIKHAVHVLKSDNEMARKKKQAMNKRTSNAFQAFNSNRVATFHAKASKLRKS